MAAKTPKKPKPAPPVKPPKPSKSERGGVVELTLEPALRFRLGNRGSLPPIIDDNGKGPPPTLTSLRDGSSNLWEASCVARVLRGDTYFMGEALSILDKLEIWYSRRLGTCPVEERVGHKGMECLGTTYNPIHRGDMMALYQYGNVNKRLGDILCRLFYRECTLLTAIAYGPERHPQLAVAGVRCVAETDPGGAEFIAFIMGTANYPSAFRKLSVKDDGFSAVARLAYDIGREMYNEGRHLDSGGNTDESIQDVFDRMVFGIGELEIRRYSDGGVLVHYPRGLAGAAVGDWEKSSRRPFCVGHPGRPPAISPKTPLGYVERTAVRDGMVMTVGNPNVMTSEVLPTGEETVRWTIKHLDAAWPEAWPRFEREEE